MILCCGDALVDMLPCETEAGKSAFAPHAGGASFNTAIALGRLGVPTEFFSGISHDLFGEVLESELARSNVGLKHAVRSDRPTTLAFVNLVDGHATYTFYSEGAADRMLDESMLPELEPAIAALQFGAISLAQEPCGSAYEALMRREHERRVILLDPNIRPDFIRDREAHLARMHRMIAMADIVKISDEDLGWFGETGDAETIARNWLNKGPKLVIVTAGSDGVTAFWAGGSAHADVEPVKVVDTVGAGDTFSAGVLASLWHDGQLTKQALSDPDEAIIASALALGNRTAAITVSRAGANPPWLHEIDN